MKAFITILIVAVIVGGIVLLTKNKKGSELQVVYPNESTGETMTNDAGGTGTETSGASTLPSTNTTSTTATTHTVSYTDQGYSPSTVTINAGDTVTFVNNSSGGMWTASNPHPVHTDFSAFDAKKSYGPGTSYSFTFTTAGTYGFHNHVHPSSTGSVVVK